ncbi:MAG TPA: hypothetical protein VFN45_05340 [Myxococcaceae bacterium]|jgi:hypothetical protein|nr:hypothetical protein [Myxococcaceae bacterium]
MALVQLGGAHRSWSVQIAPGEQSRLAWQGLPTGTQAWLMQLLPASQSPEREHCGSITHCPEMHEAPDEQSDACAHWMSTRPEQPTMATSASSRQETAEEMRTEDGRPCT